MEYTKKCDGTYTYPTSIHNDSMNSHQHVDTRVHPSVKGLACPSDSLIRATHGLSVSEKRVVLCCISQLEAAKQVKSARLRLTASEFTETFGGSNDDSYKELKTAADNLFQRYIRISRDTPNGTEEHRFRWIGSVTCHHNQRWIELAFSQEVLLNLLTLRSDLTEHKLTQASTLRSIYSSRLLDMISRASNTGFIRRSIADFAHEMNVPESYKDFFNLRKRVIEPAVSELISKGNLVIQWNSVRTGRKVTEVEFRFQENPQSCLF